jgi:hypothetical protein
MQDYIYTSYGTHSDNVEYVENRTTDAMEDDVEKIENVTLEQVMEYVNNGYMMLEYTHLIGDTYDVVIREEWQPVK